MKVLVLGSVALPVPPPFQGGTERVAYAQVTGLSQKGHEVTMIAAKGSSPSNQYRLVQIGGGDTGIGSKNASNETTSQEIVQTTPAPQETVDALDRDLSALNIGNTDSDFSSIDTDLQQL